MRLPAPSDTGTWSTGDKWGAGAVGGAGMLAALMGTSGAYGDAQNQMQQYYNQVRGDMTPFIQGGQAQAGNLNTAINSLMNPEQLQNQWVQSYQESPEAKQAQAMATQQGLDAASSMGLTGSTPALQAIQGGASNISLADRQQYLNDLMSKYTTGVNTARSVYDTGANLTGWMGEAGLAENMGNTMANLTYGKDESPWSTIGSIIGAGAGAYFGGPAGMAAGAKMGGSL